MAFCPKCKNEYREGILICPDCNCELVAELKKEETPVLYIRNESIMNRFVDYLSYSGIKTRVDQDPEDGRYRMFCAPSENERVKRAFSVFVAVETGNAMASKEHVSLEKSTDIVEADEIPEDWEDTLAQDADDSIQVFLQEDAVAELTTPTFLRATGESTQYVSAADRQRESKESGMILIILGIVLLGGVYGLRVASIQSTISLECLSVIATLMFIYGIYSIMKSRKFGEMAVVEEQTKNSILEYLRENLKKEDIVSLTADSEFEGPELDLLRQQVLNDKLREAFPDCEEALLLNLSDEWYGEQFADELSDDESSEEETFV